MTGGGSFRADIARAVELLEEFGLCASHNMQPADDVGTTQQIRGAATYLDEYQLYLSLQAYDVLLDDGALLFFRSNSRDNTKLSYGYLESPYDALSYSKFVAEYFGAEPLGVQDAWEEYDLYRSQAPIRAHVTPIRYDWSPSLYREGAHPAAHLHIGFRSEIRLSVDALLMPSHFLLFVLRHYYLACWEKAASIRDDVARIASSIDEEHVVSKFRSGRDKLELRLVSLADRHRSDTLSASDEKSRTGSRSPSKRKRR